MHDVLTELQKRREAAWAGGGERRTRIQQGRGKLTQIRELYTEAGR